MNSPRYITASQRDQKILHSTRLIFGATSAAEALRTILIDIEGPLNITDDILLFSESQSESQNMMFY